MVLMLALVAVLSGCQPLAPSAQLTCTELLATPLHSHIHQTVDPETIAHEVQQKFNMEKSNVQIATRADGGWLVSWTIGGVEFGAFSSNDGTSLERIGIDYRSVRPTVQDMQKCISSTPEWYRALYGPNLPTSGVRYSVTMFFPMQGIVAIVVGADQQRKLPPELGPDLPISHVVVVQPGSIDTLFEQVVGKPLKDVRPRLRPQRWPHDWTKSQFVEDRETGW
jgi:hypothetical protein